MQESLRGKRGFLDRGVIQVAKGNHRARAQGVQDTSNVEDSEITWERMRII